MERYNITVKDNPFDGCPYADMVVSDDGAYMRYDDAKRALDAEREKVKRLSTCGTDHSTPWWQVKCEDLEAQLATLQARNKELDRTLADVYQQRDGLQAQLRQLVEAKEAGTTEERS